MDYKSDLSIMLIEAIKILGNIGFNNIKIKDIKLSNRLKATRGQYCHEERLIEISTLHYKYSNKEDVMNTIIHELVHNICCLKYGNSYENGGHTKEWFETARYVTRNTSYKIEQYAKDELPWDKMNKVEYWYHEYRCKNDGVREYSVTKGKDAIKALNKRKCICCGDSNWEIYLTKFHHFKYS